MKIIKENIKKICKFRKFRKVKVGAIFRCLDDEETLYMRIKDFNIDHCGDNFLYNVVNLETFEIERKQDFEEVIILKKVF